LFLGKDRAAGEADQVLHRRLLPGAGAGGGGPASRNRFCRLLLGEQPAGPGHQSTRQLSQPQPGQHRVIPGPSLRSFTVREVLVRTAVAFLLDARLRGDLTQTT